MSRVAEQNLSSIFDVASQWKTQSLLGGKSLIWQDDAIWTVATLANFKTFFIDMPDTSSEKNFTQKFREQLAKADDDVTRLSCDLLVVYFLFPTSVSRPKKVSMIREVAGLEGLHRCISCRRAPEPARWSARRGTGDADHAPLPRVDAS
jgi:hypothetical protein